MSEKIKINDEVIVIYPGCTYTTYDGLFHRFKVDLNLVVNHWDKYKLPIKETVVYEVLGIKSHSRFDDNHRPIALIKERHGKKLYLIGVEGLTQRKQFLTEADFMLL